MNQEVRHRVEQILGRSVVGFRALGGGQIGSVTSVELDDGTEIVAKTSDDVPLEVEGFMLRFLASQTRLPVPRVVHAEDALLLLEKMPGSAVGCVDAERHAAELLADLHGHGADRFGFERDTLIGPFRQPNSWSSDWPAFFGEHRLRYMAGVADDSGSLPSADRDRIYAIADALPRLLDHGPGPSLIHGDVWSGNVLLEQNRVSAFLDPAIYYADAEVELAYIELFGTFGRRFFARYAELRGLRAGYRELRRDVYQLYPLLVHVAVFGEGYLGALRERIGRVESSFV